MTPSGYPGEPGEPGELGEAGGGAGGRGGAGGHGAAMAWVRLWGLVAAFAVYAALVGITVHRIDRSTRQISTTARVIVANQAKLDTVIANQRILIANQQAVCGAIDRAVDLVIHVHVECRTIRPPAGP